MSEDQIHDGITDDTAATQKIVDELASEPPIEEPKRIIITINEDTNSYTVQIDYRLNPITVAGVAWYLEQQAQIGLASQMQIQAQSTAKKPRILTLDHLPKRRGN